MLSEVCAMGGALLLGAVGDDVFGDFLVKEMGQSGVEVRGIHKTKIKNTGLSFIKFDACGERIFLSYRDHEAEVNLWNEFGQQAIKMCRAFHFTSISLVGKKQREDTLQALAYAKSNGRLVSFDVNYRQDMWVDKEAARNICSELFRFIKPKAKKAIDF